MGRRVRVGREKEGRRVWESIPSDWKDRLRKECQCERWKKRRKLKAWDEEGKSGDGGKKGRGGRIVGLRLCQGGEIGGRWGWVERRVEGKKEGGKAGTLVDGGKKEVHAIDRD
jgi:hypothetical protein